jgi:uncharacterized heparinase superfamily protein
MSGSPLPRFSLYLHTIRYLKPSQFLGRLRFRFSHPTPDLRPAPAVRQASGSSSRCSRTPSMLAPLRFRFLSVEHNLATAGDWNCPDWPKLWLYNLHYFDDLNADGADARAEWHRALIARWIAENPPAAGNGWEPYPVSLRIVNWVKWSLAGNRLESGWLQSLSVQARWLRGRLEWHLLGNHLFTNAKALVFAGVYFAGPEADAWRDEGLAIIQEQLAEQILADGGHFERSPMYHAIACEDLLDLLNLARSYPSSIPADTVRIWSETTARMLQWLRAMIHPDGDIVQFNDSAFGIAPLPNNLFRYANSMGIDAAPLSGTVTHLADTGYVRLEQGPATAFFDVAPIGPDYLPGHAHADTLTFELSLFGQRWIVDDGCSTYDEGAERLRQRGTAAHNTVVVDGADSSEVWASFRVARRARVQEFALSEDKDHCTVSASHNGYLRLPGRVTHKRSMTLSPTALVVVDELKGHYRQAVSYLLLHPDVTVRQLTAQSLELQRSGHIAALVVNEGSVRIDQAMWHPEFGSAHETHRICLTFTTSRLATKLIW